MKIDNLPNQKRASDSYLMETLKKHQSTEGSTFEVVMTLGAGDMGTFVKPIKELLN